MNIIASIFKHCYGSTSIHAGKRELRGRPRQSAVENSSRSGGVLGCRVLGFRGLVGFIEVVGFRAV